MNDIHSCSYYCSEPGCIERQRNELRDKLPAQVNLYHKVNLLLAHIGFEGGVSLKDQVYLDTMDALYEIDGGVYDSKRA